MLISCLCVTHERPEWMPWLLHQFHKQESLLGIDTELVIVDSTRGDTRAANRTDLEQLLSPSVRILSSEAQGISDKRTTALAAADGELVAWFDDDDWSCAQRLHRLVVAMTRSHEPLQAVGGRHAFKVDARSLKCATYESTYEPIVFNGALYRRDAVPRDFRPALVTGEDTDWQMRWLKRRPSYAVLGGEPLSAWMCHGKNISNTSSSHMFQLPCAVPFDAWERDFLASLAAA